MKTFNQPIELIVTQKPGTAAGSDQLNKHLKKAGIQTEQISKSVPGKKIKTALPQHQVIKTNARDTEMNPWDMAHLSADAMGKNATYIEPNLVHEMVVDRKVDVPAKGLSSKSFGSGKSNDNYDPDWQPHANLIWHLDDQHSQLKTAREQVANLDAFIRIGHLDTGYSPTHYAIPDEIRKNKLQRNFVQGEDPNDAHDPFKDGFLKQPGHGTGTLGLLAGKKIKLDTDNGVFNDYLGAAYFAEVVSCRIAESVILLKTDAFANGLNYLTQLTLSGTPVHVLSMSMGGAPSRIWADAVNAAYEAGIVMVTAAGNNFAGLPTRHVIYPARFGRVIAACGVTNDFKPYYTKKLSEMQGCFGPKKDMGKALSAFTPNTPWASVESGTVRFSGAGTSSATPQIAAAAAIYYRKYYKELSQLLPWQRVEAIRYALYTSARKKTGSDYDKDFANYFGNGIIQANDALNIPVTKNLLKTPEDEVPWFPVLNTIFKAKPNPQQSIKLDMFNTELSQLVFDYPELRLIIDDDARDYEKVSAAKWKKFREAVIHHPGASVTLKKYLKGETLK